MRVTKVLLISALAMAFAAGPAAAAATVIHTTFHGTSAEAVWRQGGPSFFTETFVNVTKMPNGQQLSVGQITENYDSEGAFAGAVGTSTRVTTGFSYTLTRASYRTHQRVDRTCPPRPAPTTRTTT